MRIRGRVRLHLITKRTVEGVVLKRPRWGRGCWVLGDARVENDHGELVAAAGRVFVDAARVEYAQTGWPS